MRRILIGQSFMDPTELSPAAHAQTRRDDDEKKQADDCGLTPGQESPELAPVVMKESRLSSLLSKAQLRPDIDT